MDVPEPRIDPEPDPGEAAGGVDAVLPRRQEEPMTPEPPIGEHPADDAMPAGLETPEEPDEDAIETQPDDEETTEEPTG